MLSFLKLVVLTESPTLVILKTGWIQVHKEKNVESLKIDDFETDLWSDQNRGNLKEVESQRIQKSKSQIPFMNPNKKSNRTAFKWWFSRQPDWSL